MKLQSEWIRLSGVLLAAGVLMTGCGEAAGDKQTKTGPEAYVQDGGSGLDDSGATPEDGGSEQADSGSAMPAFTAKDLDGSTVTESIFADKDLTVVNIWGTFCGPCVREMPELGAWAKDMPDNVQLIGLVIDIAGEEDTERHDLAVSIMQNAEADFTQIVANQDFADILKDVYGVPTTMFVDQDGNIVGDPIIGADVDGYKQFVEEYLNGQ